MRNALPLRDEERGNHQPTIRAFSTTHRFAQTNTSSCAVSQRIIQRSAVRPDRMLVREAHDHEASEARSRGRLRSQKVWAARGCRRSCRRCSQARTCRHRAASSSSGGQGPRPFH